MTADILDGKALFQQAAAQACTERISNAKPSPKTQMSHFELAVRMAAQNRFDPEYDADINTLLHAQTSHDLRMAGFFDGFDFDQDS